MIRFLFMVVFVTPIMAKTLVFGVFAYRSEPKMIRQYQPLVDHIARELNTTVILKVLSQEKLDAEVKAGKIDIVSTNPTHFISLRKEGKLTGAIATEIKNYNGVLTPFLGGVILTRSNQSDIRSISDIRGKTIAIPGKKYLGGYQTQACELAKYGINLPQDAILQEVNSHEEVVKAVMSGSVDVGFVRAGIIEEMIDEYKLNPKELFIINEHHFPIFPLRVSTHLYPEWSVSAGLHIPISTIKQIAIALYNYTPKNHGSDLIDGFTIPADYAPIDSLARTLRLPPYEATPDFTLTDIWEKYTDSIVVSTIVLIFIMGLTRWFYRRMAFQKAYTQSILDETTVPIIVTDGQKPVSVNKTLLQFFGFKSLKALRSEHSCICDYFEEGDTDEYLMPMMDDQQWTEYIIQRPDQKHKAKITRDGKTSVFEVHASMLNDGDQKRYVVAFTDISSILSLSTTDTLTGIANRLHFSMVFEHLIHLAHRQNHSLGVIFLDIDRFKEVNDTYGHLIGDSVLIHLSRLLKEKIRKSDLLARWGGEEFIIILPNSSIEQTVSVAEILRQTIENETFEIVTYITCSFGVTTLRRDERQEEILKRVDQLLYRAKDNGRNCVISE